MYRTITIAALLLLTANAALTWTDEDRGGSFGSLCGIICQSPDGGMYSRNSTTGNYSYTPPSQQPSSQPPYYYNPSGAYNGYSDGRNGYDYRDEQKWRREAPRNTYGEPQGGYRW